MKQSRSDQFFVSSFWRSSWWVVLFCLGAFCFSYQSFHVRSLDIRELEFRLEEIEKVQALASAEREDLETRIASQTDPAWIEMVLMRELGVVPEGWLKIHFH